MFIDAKFQETFLPSSGNINDYVTHLVGNNRTCGPGWEEVVQCD